MLTSKQRATLRTMSNGLQPVTQIGKGGITDAVLQSIDKTLETRELVKITVLETADVSAKEAITIVARALRANEVSAVGSKFVIYRKSQKNPTIEI